MDEHEAKQHDQQPTPPADNAPIPGSAAAIIPSASNASSTAPPDLRNLNHGAHTVNYHAPTPPLLHNRNHNHHPPPPPPLQPLYSNGLPPITYQQPPANAYSMTHPPPYIVAAPWNPNSLPTQAPPNNPAERWPLPPQSSSVPGQKKGPQKEVKRRTKTGCLTCRKRRIKCDEHHPTCDNCRKSKRACLGYDPIFKHSASSPQPIQPAPSSSHSPTAPPVGSSVPPYAYGHNPPPNPGHHFPGNPLVPGPQAPAFAPSPYPPPIMSERRIHPVSMDDLFKLNNISPPYQPRHPPPALSHSAQQEIADFYNYHYGPGLNRLLETSWYSNHGLQQLQQDPTLNDFVAQCVDAFKARTDDPQATQRIESLEARLVWHLVCMPRLAAQKHDDRAPSMHDLLSRIDTLESLLNGQLLDPQRIPLAPQGAPGNSAHNEQAFWHQLGRCCAARDDLPNPAGFREANDALQAMRAVLDTVEARDVLYSVAIGRHIGGRMPDFHPQRPLVAPTADPNDDVNRLKVAHSFLVLEDQHGATQVIQRISGMALRGWALQKPPPQQAPQA